MWTLSDEGKKEFSKPQTWAKMILLIILCFPGMVIINLHNIAPLFPLLFIFDLYLIFCLFGPLFMPERFQYLFSWDSSLSLAKNLLGFLPYLVIVLLIHLVYWQECSFIWHRVYQYYFE